MPLPEGNILFLPPLPSPSLPLSLFLLPFLFPRLSMCLPSSKPLLLSPLHIITHCVPLPPFPHLSLLPIVGPPIQLSSPPLVLLTIPLLLSPPLSTLPSSTRHPFLLPLHGLHPQSSPPSILFHHLIFLPLLVKDLLLLHSVHHSIPLCLSPCLLLTIVVCVSLRSCTGDTKQLQSQQRPRPCRQSLK